MRGIISIEKIRPDGLEYPIGLSNIAGGPIFNAATNSTGGDQTMDSTDVVHTFTSSNTFIPSFDGFVEVLVIGGGGAGETTNWPGGGSPATYDADGGGAGGLIHLTNYRVNNGASYNVTVGAGGGPTSSIPGTPTTFDTIEALGGQGGANTVTVGGSGGGGAPITVYNQIFGTPTSSPARGLGTQGQGFPGGSPFTFSGGSGGGGAGTAGFPNGFSNSATANVESFSLPTPAGATAGSGGAGGIGLYFSISGANTGYAGGGGGFYSRSAPPDGASTGTYGLATEGGGRAAASTPLATGAANRGGGGGAAVSSPPAPGIRGAGGSGIVIVRYSANQSTTFLESVIN